MPLALKLTKKYTCNENFPRKQTTCAAHAYVGLPTSHSACVGNVRAILLGHFQRAFLSSKENINVLSKWIELLFHTTGVH